MNININTNSRRRPRDNNNVEPVAHRTRKCTKIRQSQENLHRAVRQDIVRRGLENQELYFVANLSTESTTRIVEHNLGQLSEDAIRHYAEEIVERYPTEGITRQDLTQDFSRNIVQRQREAILKNNTLQAQKVVAQQQENLLTAGMSPDKMILAKQAFRFFQKEYKYPLETALMEHLLSASKQSRLIKLQQCALNVNVYYEEMPKINETYEKIYKITKAPFSKEAMDTILNQHADDRLSTLKRILDAVSKPSHAAMA